MQLTDSDASAWLDRYGKAWEARDADAAAALFTAAASYRETPFADPFEGRDAIRNYWAGVTADQTDIDFSYELIVVQGTLCVARWSTRFRSISNDAAVELNGIFVLDFTEPGQVSSLREWWHVR